MANENENETMPDVEELPEEMQKLFLFLSERNYEITGSIRRGYLTVRYSRSFMSSVCRHTGLTSSAMESILTISSYWVTGDGQGIVVDYII